MNKWALLIKVSKLRINNLITQRGLVKKEYLMTILGPIIYDDFLRFSVEKYVVRTHQKHLAEVLCLVKALLRSTHNICFMEKYENLSWNYQQIIPYNKSSDSFLITIKLWKLRQKMSNVRANKDGDFIFSLLKAELDDHTTFVWVFFVVVFFFFQKMGLKTATWDFRWTVY